MPSPRGPCLPRHADQYMHHLSESDAVRGEEGLQVSPGVELRRRPPRDGRRSSRPPLLHGRGRAHHQHPRLLVTAARHAFLLPPRRRPAPDGGSGLLAGAARPPLAARPARLEGEPHACPRRGRRSD
jgi:hypothetical protein